jgi:hypothetical protein
MKAVNKGVQRKVRRRSITMLNQIKEMDEKEQKRLDSDLDNLSNEGSDDEGYADFHKFKRMDSCDYARSPIRSRESSGGKVRSRSRSRSGSPRFLRRSSLSPDEGGIQRPQKSLNKAKPKGEKKDRKSFLEKLGGFFGGSSK